MIRILQTNVHSKLLTPIVGLLPRLCFAIQTSSIKFASYINGVIQELFSIHPHHRFHPHHRLCLGHCCRIGSRSGSKNRYIYNVIRLGILSLLFTLVEPVHAQESGKAHYVLKKEGFNANLGEIQTALSNRGSLDNFRFANARRKIAISRTDVVVELFSAKELLDLYGKKRSARTLKDGKRQHEVLFLLTEEGFIKEHRKL